jgi:hypothetical protein
MTDRLPAATEAASICHATVWFADCRVRTYPRSFGGNNRAAHHRRQAANSYTVFTMTAPHKKPLFGLLLVLAVGIACWCQDSRNTESHNKSLVLLPGAFDVQYATFQGKPQLTYRIHVDYPAGSALKAISGDLGAEGWKPLKSDFWNPSIPSSHVRGWEQFDDATDRPRTTVHSWMAQWENPQHDIVSYTLEYRYPVDAKPDLGTLRVIAIFIPASIAARMPKAN